MTERMIENRIKKLQEIEAQQKELEAAASQLHKERPHTAATDQSNAV